MFERMILSSVFLVLSAVFLVLSPVVAAGAANERDLECIVSISGYRYPVMYDNGSRNNPDGTFYPGDGFHFLFVYRALDTCQGVLLHPVESSNAITLQSHYVVSAGQSEDADAYQHSHNHAMVRAKMLETRDYYRVIDTVWYRWTGTCVHVGCHANELHVILEGDPLPSLGNRFVKLDDGKDCLKPKRQGPSKCDKVEIWRHLFSIREDQGATGSQQRVIDSEKSKKCFSCTDYRITSSFAWGMTNVVDASHVHPAGNVTDGHHNENSDSDFERRMYERCAEKFRGGYDTGCVFGHAEIDDKLVSEKCLLEELEKMNVGFGGKELGPDDECIKVVDGISLRITGNAVRCDSDGCTTIKRQGTSDLTPVVLVPDLEGVLTKPPLLDADGYTAMNLDGTYYVWDPVNVVHAPVFKWKDHRPETIWFNVTKTWKSLTKETELQCRDGRCAVILVHPNATDSAWDLGSGEGLTVYYAPSFEKMGMHVFNYTFQVYNIDKLLNTAYGSTDALVVAYDPVFTHYEYPVLADGAKYAYDDRQGMVVRYFGSVGSGVDDDVLHPDRRSKINAFYSDTRSFSDRAGIAPLDIDDGLLVWDSIGHINGTDADGWLSTGDHAMFEDEGYGIIRLDQKLAGIVKTAANQKKWYYNTTTFNEIASDNWAGYNSYRNWNYTYQYPDTAFAKWYNVTAYNVDGSVEPLRIKVDATVLDVTHTAESDFAGGGEDVVMMLDQYVYAKTLHDTGDPVFSRGVADETYDMTNHSNNTGDGRFSMWMNKTGLEFLGGYASVDGRNILNHSRYLAFDLDAPLVVGMTAGSRFLERTLWSGFQHPYHEKFTQLYNQKNVLEIERVSGDNVTALVRLAVPEHFGQIHAIYVNDKPFEFGRDCYREWCTIAVFGTSSVTVQNVWGGNATGMVDAVLRVEPADPQRTMDNSWYYLFFLAMVAVVCWVAYASIVRIKAFS